MKFDYEKYLDGEISETDYKKSVKRDVLISGGITSFGMYLFFFIIALNAKELRIPLWQALLILLAVCVGAGIINGKICSRFLKRFSALVLQLKTDTEKKLTDTLPTLGLAGKITYGRQYMNGEISRRQLLEAIFNRLVRKTFIVFGVGVLVFSFLILRMTFSMLHSLEPVGINPWLFATEAFLAAIGFMAACTVPFFAEIFSRSSRAIALLIRKKRETLHIYNVSE